MSTIVENKWLIVAFILAVLVIALVTFRMFTPDNDPDQSEILTANGEFQQQRTKLSQDELNKMLQQMENKLSKKQDKVQRQKNSTSSKDIEQLQKQIDQLGKQLTELSKALASSGILNPSKRNEELLLFKEAANDPVMREKYQQFEEELARKQQGVIDQAFQEEVVDEGWASESSDIIKTKFYQNQALVAADLTSVDCRTSMCRVTVSIPEIEINNSDDAAEQFAFENELLASLSSEMPDSTIRSFFDGNGGKQYEVFLFKKGTQRPGVNNPLEGKSMAEKVQYIEGY